MKKLLAAGVLLFTLSVAAQKSKSTNDSLQHYQKELRQLQSKTWDSLRNSGEYKSLMENISRLRSSSHNYSGPVFLLDVMHTNFGNFNTSIQQSGFKPLRDVSLRVGFGISAKYRSWITDVYFATIGFDNKVNRNNESIETSLSSLLHFDFGYDLLRSRKISIYPYLGLALRTATLKYYKQAQINSNYTNISDLITNNTSVEGHSLRLGLQAGIGVDILVANNEKKGVGRYLFIKVGTNRAAWDDRFKIEGFTYDPDINHGDWTIAVGLKWAHWQ